MIKLMDFGYFAYKFNLFCFFSNRYIFHSKNNSKLQLCSAHIFITYTCFCNEFVNDNIYCSPAYPI